MQQGDDVIARAGITNGCNLSTKTEGCNGESLAVDWHTIVAVPVEGRAMVLFGSTHPGRLHKGGWT